MFKKSKPKLAPAPLPPSLEDILNDIDKFSMPQKVKIPINDEFNMLTNSQYKQLPLNIWWQQFDHFEEALKDLIATNSTVDDYKQKLQACETEIETETNKLRSDIEAVQLSIEKLIG